MSAYSSDELMALYELGRMYYEMGYFAPAERIFIGLAGVDDGETPSRVGLGLVKLDSGLLSDAAMHFRSALQQGTYQISARFGLCCTFVAGNELDRAQSLLVQLDLDITSSGEPNELRVLWEALQMRVQA